jgi:F-type H+-transporting ATPase subunit epsilon
VTVFQPSGERVLAAVHGGFLSVTDEGVTILAEVAEMATDIDAGRARTALDRARSEQDLAGQRRAESRLRAVGEQV